MTTLQCPICNTRGFTEHNINGHVEFCINKSKSISKPFIGNNRSNKDISNQSINNDKSESKKLSLKRRIDNITITAPITTKSSNQNVHVSVGHRSDSGVKYGNTNYNPNNDSSTSALNEVLEDSSVTLSPKLIDFNVSTAYILVYYISVHLTHDSHTS